MPDGREAVVARPAAGAAGEVVAVLDIGTAKICCLIAEDDGGGVPRILGVGHKVSRGVRNGAVVDMEAAEQAIRATVHAAETMAGDTIRSVTLGLAGGRPHSRRFSLEVALDGHEAGEADINRVLEHGFRLPVPDDRSAVHIHPISYTIDGTTGIRDPRGLFGDQLGVILHIVTVARGTVRNLSACVGHCHLEIDDLVLSSEASGRAVLVDDELALGAICVDMGCGTTSVGAFFNSELAFADCIPIGGMHVTNDIAYGLSTPLAEAERLKTLHGCVIAGGTDERQMIEITEVGEARNAGPHHVACSRLTEIIRPRVEETLELIRNRIQAAGLDEMGCRRVVLTGGASQLTGVRELASQILDRPVRLGRPRPVRGLAESTSGPAFATCVGLLAHLVDRETATVLPERRAAARSGLGFGRIGQWFKENF